MKNAFCWTQKTALHAAVLIHHQVDRASVTIYANAGKSLPNDDAMMQKPYTHKQGQYLAFIFYYTKIHGCAPAEADMQEYFRVSPPSVHQLIALEDLPKLE